MKYFNFLQKGDTIGVCAPSMGCSEGWRKDRCNNAVKNIKKLGIDVKFSPHAFGNVKARSCHAKERAKEFEDMFLSQDIKGIISMTGGEFMVEILPFINFQKLKKVSPKLFQGYSDNTCLTFLLTTICDIATIHGENFGAFGMKKWHKSLKQNFEFLMGKNTQQLSYNKYESESDYKNKSRTGYEGYNLKTKTNPVVLTGQRDFEIKGRIIGGNLDVLCCLCGTKFDKVKEFIKKYKDEGIIWYFESCELNVLSQCRALWQLKNAGWFEGAKGFIIGRALNQQTMFDYTYFEANLEHLKDFNVPIIINADIGHSSPNWFIVNGSMAKLKYAKNKATIQFDLV